MAHFSPDYSANGSNRQTSGLSDTIDVTSLPKVLLDFIVEKNGTVSTVKGRIDRCNGCSKKQMRMLIDSSINVLKRSPKWNVGMKNGKPVRVAYTLPVLIRFNIDSTSTLR